MKNLVIAISRGMIIQLTAVTTSHNPWDLPFHFSRTSYDSVFSSFSGNEGENEHSCPEFRNATRPQ